MGGPAGSYNFKHDQGATFRRVISWKDSTGNPINLTDYVARMQLRPSPGDTAVSLELTTENSGITLDVLQGKIHLFASASTMTALQPRSYAYDLELVYGDEVVKLLTGLFILRQEVTR